MENNFYTDDGFEHFLKETTDDFKMYPSKKVWYSLYNDLHPGRRWPSLAVSIILISAILFVGISNNNSINKSHNPVSLANNTQAQQATYLKGMAVADKKVNAVAGASKNIFTGANMVDVEHTAIAIDNTSSSADELVFAQTDASTSAQQIEDKNNSGQLLIADNKVGIHVKNGGTEDDKAFNTKGIAPTTDEISTEETSLIQNNINGISTITTTASSKLPEISTDQTKKSVVQITKPNTEDKAWIENYAFQNRSGINRLKSFGGMQYYATVGVGFRSLKRTNDADASITASRSNLVATNSASDPQLDINDQVTQKSATTVEFGASLLYNISKKIRLKTGLQINYTNYISLADRLSHPTETELLLNRNNDFALVPFVSNYANSITGDGQQKLNNTTLQVSLPVGADVKLAGKNKLKWYAGATVQPSYITGGNVFAISADTKNYVEAPSLLRKWNVNTAVETFLSYRTGAGITINAGPQVRYQLMSTYDKQYNYSEKLYNIGIKLGFTKNF